jgi:hypothetical protein
MSEVFGRIQNLENALKDLARQLGDLGVRVTALELAKWAGGGSGSGAGGSAAFFACMAPSSGTIQGTWSGSAPTAGGSFTATVYQLSWSSGSLSIIDLGTQTIFNAVPAALENSKACILSQDGAGNYGVVSQSCT